MYRTITSIIATGQQLSPAVLVPGRLIGISVDYNGNGPTTILPHIGTGTAFHDIFLPSNVRVELSNQRDQRYLVMPDNMPVGPTEYRMFIFTATTAPVTINFYYEDSPAIYK